MVNTATRRLTSRVSSYSWNEIIQHLFIILQPQILKICLNQRRFKLVIGIKSNEKLIRIFRRFFFI